MQNWLLKVQTDIIHYFDMILSELTHFISRLSESAGLHPNVLPFMLVFLLLIVAVAGYTLFKLSRTDRELITAERELEVFAQNLKLLSPAADLTPNNPTADKFDLSPDNHSDRAAQNNATRKAGTILNILTDFKRQVLGEMKKSLNIKNAKINAGLQNEEFSSSLTNNADLRNKICELIGQTDKLVSFQHLVKHLSGKYFDGNYHPILNELEQLETEGEIEGQVINGKVFYKKKQKTERKYILRKGRNFRKYIG